jgi:CheY-like chemotaxis protein
VSGDRPTVLVVDDDDVFVLAVTAVLKTRYRVVRACNGSEAHRLVDRDQPDCIILDVMMDYLSEGFDVARKLRQNPATARVPIIMLTGVDQVYNLRMEVEESWVTVDRYLEKPIEPSVLLETIFELVD